MTRPTLSGSGSTITEQPSICYTLSNGKIRSKVCLILVTKSVASFILEIKLILNMIRWNHIFFILSLLLMLPPSEEWFLDKGRSVRPVFSGRELLRNERERAYWFKPVVIVIVWCYRFMVIIVMKTIWRSATFLHTSKFATEAADWWIATVVVFWLAVAVAIAVAFDRSMVIRTEGWLVDELLIEMVPSADVLIEKKIHGWRFSDFLLIYNPSAVLLVV